MFKWLGSKPRAVRVAVLFPIGFALYLAIRWAVFGRPTSATVPDAVIGALVFSIIFAFGDKLKAR